MSFLSRLFPQVRQMERDAIRIKSEREEWRQRYVSLKARAGLSNTSRPLTYQGDGLATIHQPRLLDDHRFRQAYEAGVRALGEDLRWEWRVRIGLWAAEQTRHLPGDFVECGAGAGFWTGAAVEHLGNDSRRKIFHVLEITHETAAAISGNHFGACPNVRRVRAPLASALEQTGTGRIACLTVGLPSAEEELEVGEHFWSRIVPGGLVLLWHCGDAGNETHRREWEHFSERHATPLLPLPTGQAMLLKTDL
jgi:hypothetical protein